MARLVLLFILLFPSLSWAIALQVKISGLDDKMAASIRSDLHIQHAITEPKLTETRIQNLFFLAENQIITTLQARGYYHAKVNQSLTKIDGSTPDQDTWVASFDIELGKPTILQNIELSVDGPGRDNPRIKPFLALKKLIPGKVLTHEDYEDTKEKLLSDFNSIGYLKANFSQHTIEVNKQDYKANIIIKINTDILFVFGKVHFEENIYPEEFLSRYVPFKPGQAYETQKLIDFQQNLETADLFSKIRFDPTVSFDNAQDNTVPIDVRLTPKPKNRYSGSVGYGTDTGPRASVGWLHRRAHTQGHKILTNLTASKVRRAGKINYIIPGKRAATDRYTLGVVVQEDRFDEIYSRKSEIFANNFLKRGNTESLYGINCFTETFRIVPTDPKRTKNYLLPNAKWTWTHSDLKDDLEHGIKLEFQIRGGMKKVLSDNNVLQTEASAKRIYLVGDKMRLLLRANAGAVATKDFASLPPSLRFFTGGDESVRGYAYNSLGPKLIPGNLASDTIGGRYLFVASAELERQIYDKISGVVFFDAGNAAMKFTGPLAMSPGFGIRYSTPLGNFRADLAKPMNMVINKHWRLHITFGTDF